MKEIKDQEASKRRNLPFVESQPDKLLSILPQLHVTDVDKEESKHSQPSQDAQMKEEQNIEGEQISQVTERLEPKEAEDAQSKSQGK